MYEFHIHHNYCGMTTVIFGYDEYDAFRRAKKDPTVWAVDFVDYID